MLVKASLRLEAAQRPQWPRLYLLSRPRSRGRMPSLVGDGGQVLHRWCDTAKPRGLQWLCVEQNHELFGDIRGRGGASNACFHS